jgi:hypothetical protein
MFAFTHAPQLLIIGLLALSQIWRRGGSVPEVEVAPADRRAVAVRYFALCGVLAAGIAFSRMLLDG